LIKEVVKETNGLRHIEREELLGLELPILKKKRDIKNINKIVKNTGYIVLKRKNY